jgi:hypothetical protein
MQNEIETRLNLGPPFPKQLEFLTTPRRIIGKHGQLDIALINMVGGRGMAKTASAILFQLDVVKDCPNLVSAWAEPTHGDIERVFMTAIRRHVPQALWKVVTRNNFSSILWYNGHKTDLLSREINNPKKQVALGSNYVGIIQDEAANGFDRAKFSQMHKCIREPKAPYLYHVTTSTPWFGGYTAWRNQPGAVTIKGSTYDNPYISLDVIETWKAEMTPESVRQQIFGDDIQLSGMIWKAFREEQWPRGNLMIGHQFDPSKPFYLSFDLGGSQSAAQVYQYVDPIHEGRRMFNGRLCVCVAEYTPNDVGLPELVSRIVNDYCGGYDSNRRPRRNPFKVSVGHDIANPGTMMPGAPVFQALGWDYQVPTGISFSKDFQRQSADALIYNNAGERRFCVAVKSDKDRDGSYRIAAQHYGEGKSRGIMNVMRNDTYPDPKEKGVFSKDKPKLGVNALEDDRDAMLYHIACNHPIGAGIGAYLGNS